MRISTICIWMTFFIVASRVYSEAPPAAASCLDLADTNGLTHNLCDKNGKKFAIMEFFLPTCGACQANAAQYKKLEEQTKDFAHSRLISLGTKQKTLVFIAHNSISTEVVLGRDSLAGNAYAITHVPTIVVIDENNQIVHRYTGVLSDATINEIKNLVTTVKKTATTAPAAQ